MTMKKALGIASGLLWLTLLAVPGITQGTAAFGTGTWDADRLGNHRAVISVAKAADAVWVRIPWRRRDLRPEQKDIQVYDALNGRQVKNVYRAEITREYGDLIFQASSAPSIYHVYYLINKMEGRSNYPTVTYQKPQSTAQADWLCRNGLASDKGKRSQFPQATLREIQAVDAFNSFFPMEVIATQAEMQSLLSEHPEAAFLLFPEDRGHPIRMTMDIPLKWIKSGPEASFSGVTARGEYYAFQIGVYAARTHLEGLKVKFSSFKMTDSNQSFSDSEFTCFNTEGVDWTGGKFKKSISLEQGHVQPLWCGIRVPENAQPGTYMGKVSVYAQDQSPRSVDVSLTVTSELMPDAGDGEPWRHSRLRWLNSLVAFDEGIVPPYTPLKRQGDQIRCLGRTVRLNSLGFPQEILSYFQPEMNSIGDESKRILSRPVRLILESCSGAELKWDYPRLQFHQEAEGVVAWKSRSQAGDLKMETKARMEFDGFLDFIVKVTAVRDTELNDIRLEIPLEKESATFMMGLGIKGGLRRQDIQWKWDQKHNQDSVWIGAVNAGLQCSVRDENYSRPLNTNFYLRKPLILPSSWWNQGRGGCDITELAEGEVLIRFYSGERSLAAGESLYYNFSLLITPFRSLDTQKQWNTRFYHRYSPLADIQAAGANMVNVHHATDINPFINYPFLRTEEMKDYIDEAHSRDMKVKIYYTVRELSNKAPELFALRSLGDEIFFPGKGGGFSWLQEHLDSDYIAAWFVPPLKDAAIINSGVSRWHNYYVEGLNWLVKNVGIDGLYIDDVAFDRTTMKRVRKVLDRNRPGAQIDLHSANQFNVRDGFANSANLYLEHFPYIDRLWFGEYFDYDSAPDFWLVEVSGIPFGLMGEMLQDGGNAWRGMLYGMTSRLPWAGNPRPLWKIWDAFGLQSARMIGYWAPSCPVRSGHARILVTAYVKDEKVLLAVASWAEDEVKVNLEIDWKTLGLNEEDCRITAPAIQDFQPAAEFAPSDPIPVTPGKGWLLLLERKK
jgi:hypothetical protein